MHAIFIGVLLVFAVLCVASTLLFPLWAIKLLGALRTRAWVAGWLEHLDRSVIGAGEPLAEGAVVSLEGRCVPATSTGEAAEALSSPLEGTPCAGWWAEVTGGPQVPLSIPILAEGRATPFRVEGEWGAAEVDPKGATLSGLGLEPVEACYPLAQLPPALATKLEQPELRLWDRLWVSQWSLPYGQPCVVVGRLTRRGARVPYRRSELPLVGGCGTLLVAAMTRDELAAKLRASRSRAEGWATVAALGVGLGSVIPAWSVLVGAWQLPVAVATFTIAAVLGHRMLDRFRELGLPPHTWPVAPPR